MGHFYEIHCSNCGLNKVIGEEDSDFLVVGNGMMDYEILLREHPDKAIDGVGDPTRTPHYCVECGVVFANEIGDNPVNCPKCKSGKHVHSYHSKEACSTAQPLTEYGDPDLTEGNYYCPRCKTFSLKFLEAGLWDCIISPLSRLPLKNLETVAIFPYIQHVQKP